MSFPGTFYSTSARTDCRSYTILCKSSPVLIILADTNTGEKTHSNTDYRYRYKYRFELSTSARTDSRSYTILCKSSPGLIILTISPFLAVFPKLYFSTVFRNCISQQQYFPTAFINGSIIPTTAFLFIFIIVQDDPRLVINHKSGV